MRRRQFIALLGGATAWPLTARAQQPAMPVIGVLGSESLAQWAGRLGAFHQGLGEAGYVEGRNVAIEYRWAEGLYNRLPALAADLIRRQPTVIFATPGIAALAAKAATTTVPIVFTSGIDPVDYGLVASLNRPGGNLTGASNLSVELTPKRLELLHELVPMATTIAFLFNPTNPSTRAPDNPGPTLTALRVAARSLGLQIVVLQASSERDFDAVFASLLQLRAGALLMPSDPFFNSHTEQLAALTVQHSVPSMYPNRDFAEAGGLASYGASEGDSFRLAGIYTGRVLRGEKPADLPVQQSTKVEMIINLKTAKALGLTVPLALLTRADEVIE
jgi:putative tryptophan/tyrosine transport system substrate-binding protein